MPPQLFADVPLEPPRPAALFEPATEPPTPPAPAVTAASWPASVLSAGPASGASLPPEPALPCDATCPVQPLANVSTVRQDQTSAREMLFSQDIGATFPAEAERMT